MGVLGGVFVLKSGLRILIRASQVPFLVPPKTPKMAQPTLPLPFEVSFKEVCYVSAVCLLHTRHQHY